MGIPTRIIEPPTRDRRGHISSIKCDDNVSYTLTDLAELVNASSPGLSQKIRKIGWDHEDVLKFNRYKLQEGIKDGIEIEIIPGDLAWLNTNKGRKDRSYNLNKIKDPTNYDNKYGTRPSYGRQNRGW